MSVLSANEYLLPSDWTAEDAAAAKLRRMSPSTATGDTARAFYAIWQGACKDRPVPRRRDVTLSMVRKLTSWMWVAEVLEGGKDYRFRLVGDGIVRYFDRNVTGFRLSNFVEGPLVRHFKEAFTASLILRQPVVFGPVAARFEAKDFWEMETLVLPLSETGEAITALMGSLELTKAGFLFDPL